MDRESLALLIAALSEEEIVELYKVKKVNNFGFRVNTVDEVQKNRKILEENLLKHINIHRIHNYFLFKTRILNIEIEGLTLSKLKKLCDNEGYTKVLITLYINEEWEYFREILADYNKLIKMAPQQNEYNDKKIVSDNRLQKTIKKLEIKLDNIQEEFKKKENNYKSEIEKTIKLVTELRKENAALKQDNNSYKIENLNLKRSNSDLQEENKNYLDKSIQLNEQINSLNDLIYSLTQKNIDNDNDGIFEEDGCDEIVIKQVLILGELSELLINIPDINFTFIGIDKLDDALIIDKLVDYEEIWIIHYDLTQKEKKIVQVQDFKGIFDGRIRDIFNLKDLNQATIDINKER